MVRFLKIALLFLFGMASASVSALAHETPHFTWHDKGLYTPIQASQMDPRFSYMMYAPRDYDEHGDKEYSLVVLVHGTERGPFRYIENNAKFADENDIILLAPIFPANTHGGKDLENYKLIDYKGTRYDLVLLSMVNEITSKYRIKGNKFNMFGFSGGGHFTHRFFYLHPHRLNAISIGAPGMVTMIDDTNDWWVGTKNLYQKFNAHLNPKAMAKVKVHMVIGEKDLDGWGDEIEEGSPYRMEGVPGASYNAAGKNRRERMLTLKKNFEDHGIAVQMDIVGGAGHNETSMFPDMQKFFVKNIEK